MVPQDKETMSYCIKYANEIDIVRFAPLLRSADIREIEASVGTAPEEALKQSISESTVTRAVYSVPDNAPLAIFGIGPADTGVGVPWMVGTDASSRYSKSLVKEGRRWLDQWNEVYPILTNIVDARNTVHLRWVRHMGFTLCEPRTGLGVDPSVPFVQIIRTTPCA
jgi:hypothetical protein